jgi:ABC-type multidrug transport system fused ATPase/permease subunit
MASLGLVIPVVQAVVSGDRRSEYEWLPDWIKDLSYTRFVQLLMVFLVITFFTKNVFLLASNYFQQRFQLSVSNRVVQRLFENYLRQPYEFHLTHSSSVLVRNVQDYSSAVVTFGLAPLLNVLTDVMTGIGLLAVLLYVEPLSSLTLIVCFGAAGGLLVLIFQKQTRRWGAERMTHREKLIGLLLGGLGGVKEIQLFGRDRQVIEAHRQSLRSAARSLYMFSAIQGLPRAAFEVIAVSGVGLLVLIASVSNRGLDDVTVIVALFGVVAFRMLPSVNRVIQSVQQFAFGRTAIQGALLGLQLEQRRTTSSAISASDSFQLLEARSVRYRYPSSERLIIDVESLRIQSGESIGIVGESGSGKSTLVDLLIGVLTPQEGVISVNSRDISTDRRYWQDRIGYVPQHVYLMDTSIRKNVAFGLADEVIDEREVEDALRRANLWDFVQSLPDGLDTVVGERGVRLSGGQRQRLGIARALYGNPEVIVLDEATSALDSETEKEIVESFREIAHNHTLIVVAHRTSTLAYCSRLIRLDNGRIVQDGSYEEVVGSLAKTIDRGQ